MRKKRKSRVLFNQGKKEKLMPKKNNRLYKSTKWMFYNISEKKKINSKNFNNLKKKMTMI